MNHGGGGEAALAPRRIGLAPIIALALLVPLFAGLAIWQVQRLAWKQALIARVDAAMHAAPIPGERLPATGALEALAYRPVVLHGQFDPAGIALVTATSTLGSGYWVMVPLRAATGSRPAIYVNRGFVPVGSRLPEQRARVPAGPVTVTGLLRLTEPKGTWLRANRPEVDRWYARDIAAIAALRHVAADPRLFIDAQGQDAPQDPAPDAADPAEPVPGLTVVTFANNHLGYALTWFTLALLCAGMAAVLWRKRS